MDLKIVKSYSLKRTPIFKNLTLKVFAAATGRQVYILGLYNVQFILTHVIKDLRNNSRILGDTS